MLASAVIERHEGRPRAALTVIDGRGCGVGSYSGAPTGQGAVLPNMRDLLRGTPQIDEAELELLRTRSLKRLAALTDSDPTGDPATQGTVEEPGPPAVQEGDMTQASQQASEEAMRVAGSDRSLDRGEDGADLDVAVAGAAAAPGAAVRPRPRIVVVEDREETAGPVEADDTDQAVLFPADGSLASTSDDVTAPAKLEPTTVASGDSAAGSTTSPETEARVPEMPTPAERAEAFAYCPYCATPLQPPPKATRRCATCRERIIVKHVGTRTVYLAEAALPVFEAERRRIAEAQEWTRMRDHWLDLALMSGASADRIARASGEAPSEGKVAAARSLYLSAVDQSFEVAMRNGHWKEAADIRYDEALVLFGFAGAPVPVAAEAVPASVAVPKAETTRNRRDRKGKG